MSEHTSTQTPDKSGSPAASTANALLQIVDAIVDSVKAAGSHGAPAGVLYSALMAHGCTLSQFQSLMGAIVSAGKLTQRGHLYFAK